MYKKSFLIILISSVLLPLTNTLIFPNNYVEYIQTIVQKSMLKFHNEQFDIDNGQCVAQLKQFWANLQNSTSDDVWALKSTSKSRTKDSKL